MPSIAIRLLKTAEQKKNYPLLYNVYIAYDAMHSKYIYNMLHRVGT